MRALIALTAAVVLAATLSACDSGGKSAASTASTSTSGSTSSVTGSTGSTGTTSVPTGVLDFKNKVAAAFITGSDLQADPGFGPVVDVSDPNGLDTIQLRVTDAFRETQAHPSRKQEIVQKLVRDTVGRMKAGNSKRSFSEVRDELMPVLKRRQVVEGVRGNPAVTPFHDLDVVYAVQTPQSFTLVTRDDLKRWGLPLSELHSIALSNLERETNTKQKLLCEKSGSQRLCGWASGDGYDATRMLVPGLRRQIVEKLGGPAVYAVPLESVFVALTRNYAPVIKDKVLQQFTTGENPLSPELFEERNGHLVVLSQ